jgi:hypothetical protein
LITEADGQHAFPSVIPQKTPSFSLAFLPQSYLLTFWFLAIKRQLHCVIPFGLA